MYAVIVNGRDGNLVQKAESENDAINKVIQEYTKRHLTVHKVEVYHLLIIE